MSEEMTKFVVDKQALLESLEGDAEFLKTVLGIFLSDYPRMLTQIKDAANKRDGVKLKNATHELKGSVSFFGVKDAVHAAQTLESMAKEEKLDNVDEALVVLEREMDRVVLAFQEIEKQSAEPFQS
jgi:HPt (histidine-containing phosphotransfer) domain-containing protein